MSIKATAIRNLMAPVIVTLVMMLLSLASSAAPVSPNRDNNESNIGYARDIRRNYGNRYQLAVPFMPTSFRIGRQHGHDELIPIDESEAESGNQRSQQQGQQRLKKSKGPGQITVGPGRPGPVFVWPVPVLSYTAAVPTKRDEGIMDNLLPTFGLPLSDTQFQILSRLNTNIELEEMFDPEKLLWMVTEASHIMATSAANSGGNLAINQAQSAIDFTEKYLRNFTAEYGNEWQKIRDKLFLPMAVLLLLPGAVLAQAKAIVASGSSVIEQSQGPFEGIMRSIVAAFLIPGSFLVINYGIDVANSITFTIGDEYKRLFGSDMYKDAQCTEIRAFVPNNKEANDNGVFKKEPRQPGTEDPFKNVQRDLQRMRDKDPCAGLDESKLSDESARVNRSVERTVTNFANVALSGAWNVLCAFQMAFLYYLWCMGPIAAALWVWPIKGLRSAFPSWVEGVITLCFWSLFWNTAVLLLACFRGVADNSVVIVSALNFLANVCVKYAFDFSGLVSEAGYQAASDMTRSMNHARDDAQKAIAGGGAQPAVADGNGHGGSGISPASFARDENGNPVGSGARLNDLLASHTAANNGSLLSGVNQVAALGLLDGASTLAGRHLDGSPVGPPPVGVPAAEALLAGSMALGAFGALQGQGLGALGSLAPPLAASSNLDLARRLGVDPTQVDNALRNINAGMMPDGSRITSDYLAGILGLDATNPAHKKFLESIMPSSPDGNGTLAAQRNLDNNAAALRELATSDRLGAMALAQNVDKFPMLGQALGLTADGKILSGGVSCTNGAFAGPGGELWAATTGQSIKDSSGQAYSLRNGMVLDPTGSAVNQPILYDPATGRVIPSVVAQDTGLRPQIYPNGTEALNPQGQLIAQFGPGGPMPTANLGPYNSETNRFVMPVGAQAAQPQFDERFGWATPLAQGPAGQVPMAVASASGSSDWTAQYPYGTFAHTQGLGWYDSNNKPALLDSRTGDLYTVGRPYITPTATMMTPDGITAVAAPQGSALYTPTGNEVFTAGVPYRDAQGNRYVFDSVSSNMPAPGTQLFNDAGQPVVIPNVGATCHTPNGEQFVLASNNGQPVFQSLTNPSQIAFNSDPAMQNSATRGFNPTEIVTQPAPQLRPDVIPEVFATTSQPIGVSASPQVVASASMVPPIVNADVTSGAAQPMVAANAIQTGAYIMPQSHQVNPAVVGEQQPNMVMGEQPRVVATNVPSYGHPVAQAPAQYVTPVPPTPHVDPYAPPQPKDVLLASAASVAGGGLLGAWAARHLGAKKPAASGSAPPRAPEVVVAKNVSGSLQQNMGANQQGVAQTDEQEIQRLAKEGLDKITGVQRVAGTKVLMVVAPEKFTDEELLKPKSIFIGEGAQVKIASNVRGEAKGTSGTSVTPDMLISEVDPADFDAIVIVGGSGAQEFLSGDRDLHQLLRTMSDTGKIVAGISLSGMVLAQAGILDGRKVTGWPSTESIAALEQANASYVDKPVVVDGEIITGGSSEHVDEFADKIIEELSKIASVSAIDDQTPTKESGKTSTT